jgi:hypothetical protein
MSSIWPEFGFRESLYATTPIPPTAEGENLLVGRDKELHGLKTVLASTSLHPTVEGDNGVGKTSLVAIAGFQLFEGFKKRRTAQALVPLGRSFQLTPDVTVDDFRRRVLFEAAQGLIDHFDDLKDGGLNVPDVTEVRRWLTRSTQRQSGGGISAAGFGATGSRGTTSNTSAGFSESGFGTVIETWLRQCFPSPQAGGFICVIDNLELLETFQEARSLLEAMRDEVLGLPGLRWVLCGSRGIVQTAASSSRLEGRLASPMTVGPLPHGVVPEVVATRRDAYRVTPHAVAPVGRRAFRHLYDVLNSNLRNALKYAEDFSLWLAAESDPPWDSSENRRLLEVWLTETADSHYAQTRLGQAAWRVFDTLAESGGTCSPSDNEKFGYNTSMALRPQIKALEDANLVMSVIDESDKRRKTISISPRGWLVRYARSGYKTRPATDQQPGGSRSGSS